MLVEFVGAAGAGKSFLFEKILDGLVGRRLAVQDFCRIPIKRNSCINILLAGKSLYLALLTRPANFSAYSYAAKEIAAYLIRQRIAGRVNGIYLCSEGLFHRIRAFSRGSLGLDVGQITGRVFRRIRPPDVVIAVEASAATVYARRQRRARPGDQFTRESVAADVMLMGESLKAIVEMQLSLGGSMQVLRLEVENEDVADLVERTASKLEEYFSSIH